MVVCVGGVGWGWGVAQLQQHTLNHTTVAKGSCEKAGLWCGGLPAWT